MLFWKLAKRKKLTNEICNPNIKWTEELVLNYRDKSMIIELPVERVLLGIQILHRVDPKQTWDRPWKDGENAHKRYTTT